jgi:phenylalanyl-tRNA synthetase beta chain
MIISVNWLKKFTKINLPIEELTTLIGARLVEIEEVINLGAKYQDIVVAKVKECHKMDNSDHLSITRLDDGGVIKNIDRGDDGLIQVVCGAPNIATGQTVVFLPPGSIVPETYDKAEPLRLDVRKLRGFTSNGMIASSRELNISDDHSGILVLDDKLAAGSSFAECYELNDYLLDIENKSLTHRPDCFGIIGFAREVAAIQGKTIELPTNIAEARLETTDYQTQLSAAIDDSTLSARYSAVILDNVDSQRQSPLEIQTYLARSGIRPINAVVDVTNYLMLLTGQPLHAFDYDKLLEVNGNNTSDIHVRAAHENEKLVILDGRTIDLTPSDIVIATGDTAIGLAGAMGGNNTAINGDTKRVVVESATYDLYKLRSTQMRHGIFSEAITRFTKGQPAAMTTSVLMMAINNLSDWTGAHQISQIIDVYPGEQAPIKIDIDCNTINQILGSNFSKAEISQILSNAEFEINSLEQNSLSVVVPKWRTDIHIAEDIVEEVGRLNGFDNLRPTMPKRDFMAVRPSDFDKFRSHIRKILVRAGSNEVLTYSFIHGDVLKKAGQDPTNSYRIINSISPDLQYYRQSITPSLLGLVHSNAKQGYDKFTLFELNKSQSKADALNSENVPVETERLAVVTTDNSQTGVSYYSAKRLLTYLADSLRINLVYQAIGSETNDPIVSPFEYRRSAKVLDDSGRLLGIVGEYKKTVSKDFKLPEFTAGFELNLRDLFTAAYNKPSSYKPLSRYPASERDICFQVNDSVNYDQIIESAKNALQSFEMESSIVPVDIYQSEIGTTKNITIRIKLNAHDHTLVADEVADVSKAVIEQVMAAVGATVI